MPEGPEIRRAADAVESVLRGRELMEVYFAFPHLRRFERRVTGATVVAVDTRGKAMLTRFDNGLTLYSHNQLYGRWYTSARGDLPHTNRSLRVGLHTAAHSALLYSASDVDVLTKRQLDRHPFLNRIGPDILDPELTATDIVERLGEPRFAGKAVNALYLDQSFLAGTGNYLRSEILHTSRVHPASRPRTLDAAARRRLARETLKLSRRSYRSGGILLPRDKARRLRKEGMTYGQYRFWVFGREGLPCHSCGTSIERIDAGSRGLFFCPVCQTDGRPGG